MSRFTFEGTTATTDITPNNRLSYRKDIDGLRGLSILLVLAYHFGLSPITGGYIGVDVFFVISGYLITSLLKQETSIGTTLINFYKRRIKRLLPMFLVFATVTTAASIVLLMPEDFIAFFKSLREALLFHSNVFFDTETKNYFGPNARELPLLHTWSLSIEWQFYLIFPILFLVGQKFLPQRVLKILLCSAAILFAAFSIDITLDSSNAYFLTSARFFELLVGACTTQFLPKIGRFIGNAIVALSLVAIIAIATFFTPATTFPGMNALVICLLSATIIVYGQGNRILTNPVLAHIGRISYSSYLWHWPLIAFLTYLQISISTKLAMLLIASVLLTSHLTHAIVEIPGRRLQMGLGKAILFFIAAPLLIVLIALTLIRLNDGLPQRLGEESIRIHNNLAPYLKSNQNQCHDFKGTNLEECSFGDMQSNTRALLIGDSHARHYWQFVKFLAENAHLKVLGLTKSECLMLPGTTLNHHGVPYTECQDAVINYFKMIQNGNFKYVFIGQRWIGYQPKQLDFLDLAVEQIIANGAIPVILGPVAEDGTDKKECFYLHIKLRRTYANDCSIDQSNPFGKESKQYVALLFERIHRKYPSVRFIDTQAVQCQASHCKTVIDGTPIYADTHHLNGFGSAILARQYVARFGNPLFNQ